MCDGITREQIATEREIANYKLSQYIMEITDSGKTLVGALVGIMEGNEPGTTPQNRQAPAPPMGRNGLVGRRVCDSQATHARQPPTARQPRPANNPA